jgi:hypothetical protein
MPKKSWLMYICLLGCAASMWGPTTAVLAAPVDPLAASGIAADIVKVTGAHPNGVLRWVLCTDGSMYYFEGAMFSYVTPTWAPMDRPIPVAVSDMADWTPEVIRTRDGHVWIWMAYDDQYAWREWGVSPVLPTAPCETVTAVEPSSLGKLKSLFR